MVRATTPAACLPPFMPCFAEGSQQSRGSARRTRRSWEVVREEHTSVCLFLVPGQHHTRAAYLSRPGPVVKEIPTKIPKARNRTRKTRCADTSKPANRPPPSAPSAPSPPSSTASSSSASRPRPRPPAASSSPSRASRSSTRPRSWPSGPAPSTRRATVSPWASPSVTVS